MKKEPQKELDVKYILKTYWGFLRPYRRWLSLIFVLILGMILLGFGSRLIFKRIIDNAELFSKGTITAEMFFMLLGSIFLIWTLITLANAFTRWLRSHYINKLESHAMFDLKSHYYSHLVNLSHKFHTTHKTGSLIARINRGSSALERLTDFITHHTLPFVIEIFVSGLALITIDKKIGGAVILTGIVLAIYSTQLQKIQRKRNTITNKAEDIEKAMIGDTFTNIDSIKHYGKEVLINKRYSSLADNTKNALLRQWTVGKWMGSGEGLITGLGSIAVLYISIQLFIQGEITLGTVTFANSLYWAMIQTTQGFMDGLRGYNRAIADFDDLFQYGKISNDIKDKPGAKNLEIKEGNILFKNVSFKYNQKNLFSNFNLDVKKNSKVALVGHSGSGKSTIVKLLYRLYDLEKGSISIDGINIADVKQESLRGELSIVPQECVLFDDTIYNNILFSNPTASREEVLQAIRFAQLDKTIANFPQKENTIVGERGVKLSGGEKQRVSIARAILANKKVLVLDEATSSLDSKTESEIQRDLQRLMQNRTSIIIAHRLSTIMKSDVIIVLDKGKIAQMGSHKDLIKKKGIYQELWSLQKGGYVE